MKKRLAAVLAAMACLAAAAGSGDILAATPDETYAGSQLETLGILKGYEDGLLHLDRNITRAQVATLAVRMLGYEGAAVPGTPMDFSDIGGHWAEDNVDTASILGLVNGYPDGSFKPENNITYAEVVAIMVNTLGQSENLEGSWPDNYLEKARAIGIINEETELPANKVVTRGEMAVLVYYTILTEL